MTQASELAAKALMLRRKRTAGNTRVYRDENKCQIIELFGNPIAKHYPDDSIWISCAKWPSVTTHERLDALLALVKITHSSPLARSSLSMGYLRRRAKSGGYFGVGRVFLPLDSWLQVSPVVATTASVEEVEQTTAAMLPFFHRDDIRMLLQYSMEWLRGTLNPVTEREVTSGLLPMENFSRIVLAEVERRPSTLRRKFK